MSKNLFPMMNRRNLFATTTAAAALAATTAEAVENARQAIARNPKAVQPRGHNGIFVRLPSLDVESQTNFLSGTVLWQRGPLRMAAEKRANEILKANGIDPNADIPFEQAVALLEADPILAMDKKSWMTHQKLKWTLLQNTFHANADAYLDEMEAADKMGPGVVELNPTMTIPDYTALEIHVQPGGYVGDPFAGHMYRYATDLGSYSDRNYQDETHRGIASSVFTPTDGKVKRCLEMGCSVGQLVTTMKERFPEAECWGVDVGGPMVRYAHMKAVDMGANVNFRQALAEDTKFPNNHFDIVTAYLLFHEVSDEGAKGIIKEAARVLRPGGIFQPIDVYTSGPKPKTAYQKFGWWHTYRWNHESWYADWVNLDVEAEMKKAGFKIGRTDPGGARGGNNLYGIKT